MTFTGNSTQVRTIKIRNTTEQGGTPEAATEEELRKATEKLTLSCLSPNTLHRDRSKTHNPQLFSGLYLLSGYGAMKICLKITLVRTLI